MTAGSHLNNSRWTAHARLRMTGVENTSLRQKDDFYPTPPEATLSLLDHEQFAGAIWEPACGDGAISKLLLQANYEVISSDLCPRGYGETGIDFLMEWEPRAPNVVTNPPFKLAVPFVRKARQLCSGKIAMLLKLQFLEGKERAVLFREHPLARVLVFSRRISFKSGSEHAAKIGGGMMCFAWFVWDPAHAGKPTIDWIGHQPAYDPAKNASDGYDLAIKTIRDKRA